MSQKLVLGTRGSELARTQTGMAIDHLRKRHPDLELEIQIIKTGGDERPAIGGAADWRAGRKGLFTAEIERALLAGEIAAAVHSAKDLPSALAPGTEIAAVLPRGPVEDVLVGLRTDSFESLPPGAVVATGSVRRKHQLRQRRPDLKVVDVRGNVPTRLRKLAEGGWDGMVLARAGLERLGFLVGPNVVRHEQVEFRVCTLPRELFLPAGGQGIVAIQIRAEDDRARKLIHSINHLETAACLRAERSFLHSLDGDCNQPVGVLAVADGTLLRMRGQIFEAETAVPKEGAVEGLWDEAEELGVRLFKQIHGKQE